MFKQVSILLAVIAIALAVDYPSQEQYSAELKAAGMTQSSIDGLAALSQKFVAGFPLVQANKAATDKFIADFTQESNDYVKTMSPEDQKIYNDSLKKYGLA